MNERFSIFIRKVKASPPSPQPKQWNVWRSGLTMKDGVRSWWNGQRPLRLRPARCRPGTYSETSSAMFSRARMFSSVSAGIKPNLLPPWSESRPGAGTRPAPGIIKTDAR